ncbi:MAG: ribonuclease E/G, partial [Cyanobacteria bacterium CAN_BIN43]|nr:ribonuclease E/G [Cyanobacteria bacterium CAN_BIN43]
VIDVNSGSFTRSATARETVLWTNSEAATEIARQLRLRNIAGVIIVDFIDMDANRDKLQVLEQFNKSLRADKARPQIAQLSELGLVELTRKRQGQNIYELFGRVCTTCGGLGHLVHLPGEADSFAVEPLEAFRSVGAIAEPRSISSREPAREVWEKPGEDLDLDSSSDLQELDLANHPSYSPSRNNENRRRRGRVRVGEPISRNPAGRIAPAEVVNDEPSDSLEQEIAIEEAPTPTPLPTRNPNREARPEKAANGRSARRERPPAEPPQVVSVEMTEEEQDVYSFMGISPLILSTEPIKDPKSIIVAVALPGQSTRMPNGASVTLPPPTKLTTVDTAQEVDETDEADDIESSVEPVHYLEPEVVSSYAAPVLVKSVAPELQKMGEDNGFTETIPEANAAGDSLGEDNGSAQDSADNTRRRRRRSSTAN